MIVTPYLQYKNRASLPPDYWKEKQGEEIYTYVWQFPFTKDGYTTYGDVELDGLPLDEIASDFPDFPTFENVKLNLFSNDDLSVNNDLWRYRDLLNKYFEDTLTLNPLNKKLIGESIEKTVLIAPQETVNEIKKTIQEFNLIEFNDFIFFIIAKIQQVYVDKIEHLQEKESQAELKEFPKECEKLLKVVEKNSERRWNFKKLQNKKPSQLQKITFHFDNDKPIHINNSVLLSLIIRGIVNLGGSIINPGDEVNFVEWKKHIRDLTSFIYSPQQEKDQFKYNIAKALSTFLSEQTSLKETNRSAIFIGKILSFAYLIESEKEFTEHILPSSTTYKVGPNSKITPYEKFLQQNIKGYISKAK